MRGLVFVSSPFASIECKERDRNYYAKELALEACRQVRLNGYEPISPVLAWMDVYSELEREKVIKYWVHFIKRERRKCSEASGNMGA